MPEEMRRLRNALQARGVEYEDRSDDFDRSFPFFDMTLYKIWFKHNGHTYEAMSGVGTLGNEWGLIELRVDQGEPFGSMTAEGVLKMLDRG